MQKELWHDSIYDALLADITAAGGVKKVAGQLWPTLASETAATRLRNSLNPEQAQKLDPEEILAIKRLARDAGSSSTVQFEDQYLGKRSEWTAPEDERMRLQREFVEMGKQMQRLAAQIGQQDQRLRAVP